MQHLDMNVFLGNGQYGIRVAAEATPEKPSGCDFKPKALQIFGMLEGDCPSTHGFVLTTPGQSWAD